MRIPDPETIIQNAIHDAVKWLEDVKITGYSYRKVPIDERPYHATTINYDRVLVADPEAPPVWARFYDLEQSKPFLSKRDGTIVYNLSEISFDRRIGYAWYGYWPLQVFEKYELWKNKL